MHTHSHMHACLGMYVAVRGSLAGVSSPLPPGGGPRDPVSSGVEASHRSKPSHTRTPICVYAVSYKEIIKTHLIPCTNFLPPSHVCPVPSPRQAHQHQPGCFHVELIPGSLLWLLLFNGLFGVIIHFMEPVHQLGSWICLPLYSASNSISTREHSTHGCEHALSRAAVLFLGPHISPFLWSSVRVWRRKPSCFSF